MFREKPAPGLFKCPTPATKGIGIIRYDYPILLFTTNPPVYLVNRRWLRHRAVIHGLVTLSRHTCSIACLPWPWPFRLPRVGPYSSPCFALLRGLGVVTSL